MINSLSGNSFIELVICAKYRAVLKVLLFFFSWVFIACLFVGWFYDRIYVVLAFLELSM